MVDRPSGDDAADTDHTARSRTGTTDTAGDAPGQSNRDCMPCTEAYEVDDGLVLFDADNPLAWIEADRTVQVKRMV